MIRVIAAIGLVVSTSLFTASAAYAQRPCDESPATDATG